MKGHFSIFFLSLTLCSFINADGGGSSTLGTWKVINPTSNIPCIGLTGQIDLQLSYIEKGTDAVKDGHVSIPPSSTVNSISSCSVANIVNSDSIHSQLIQLDFYHLPGWNMKMYFSTDPRLQTNNGKEWALYQINVTANYTAMPDQFPNPADSIHSYVNVVDLKGDNEIADNVYASVDSSLQCKSKQLFILNDDPKVGPRATITFSLLQIQAYITTINYSKKPPFGTVEQCIPDQHQADLVPIIVGSVLAGLIVFTMVAYLIYRACLPDDVIRLVNPESHFNEGMSLDEDDDIHSYNLKA